MKVRIKRLNERAVIPSFAKDGDAGLDLIATSLHYERETQCLVYGTGLAIEIPKGYVGKIYPRSSISKYALRLANSVGIIDSGYRGELLVKFKSTTYLIDDEPSLIQHEGEFYYYSTREILCNCTSETIPFYRVGDKICQLIIEQIPTIELEEVSELSETKRGIGGFGSSDLQIKEN